MIKQFFPVLIVIINSLYQVCVGQIPQDGVASHSHPQPIKNLIAFYENTIGISSPIYSGREYVGYDLRINGHPYYSAPEWQTGSLLYDSLLYQNVLLNYDLALDALIVQSPENFNKIVLNKEKISWFQLNDHLFANLATQELSGFYDVLMGGSIQFFVKNTKHMNKEVRNKEIYLEFVEETKYFVQKDGETHRIDNKRDLFKIFALEKKDMKKMLNKRNLKFKNDPERAILSMINFYEERQKNK